MGLSIRSTGETSERYFLTYGRGPHYTNVYSYITRSVC
eukprot:COSAG02_NODE_43578_length_373_cov_1.127737_1_plen_37_part_10